MRVLIVGGAGYVGGAVTDLLAETGHEMRVFDALLYEEDYRKRVPFICGDIRDRKKLLACLDWADAVGWLAAIVGDGACALNPDIATEINQVSVEWLAKNYDGRIVFISTCSVYGAQDKELDEESPINPDADLKELGLDSLQVKMGVGNSTVVLPREGSLDAQVEGAIGQLNIQVPEGMEVLVRTNTALSGVSVPEEYVRTGDVYKSPGYDQAEERTNLNLDLAIGNVVIEEAP